MKTFKILSLFLCLSFSIIAAERSPLDKETRIKVIKALDLNDDLHMAFFEYKAKEVELKAKELRVALAEVKTKELKELFTKAISELSKIKSSVSREENNEHYAKASLPLVVLVNKYNVGAGYNEYTCPMVRKKWVQNSSKRARVHNPYAPEMPHCGGQVTDY